MSERKQEKTWTKTRVQNLWKHRSGVYYGRLNRKGKDLWRSLKTELLEVAKARLSEFTGEVDKAAAPKTALGSGRMSFGEAAAIFLERLKSSGLGLQGKRSNRKRITVSSIHYREQTINALLKSWPELATLDVRKITESDCERWSEQFAMRYSATRFNNTLDSMRHVFALAIKSGARHGNPAETIGRCEVPQKAIRLPERSQFLEFVQKIETAGAWCSRDCANLVRMLAFTGCRKNEAANVLWGDVDFERGRIHLRITKNGKPRYVPMIPDARALFEKLKAEREHTGDETPVLLVREAQKAMDHAAEKVGMSRITHHDLRHLFATQCIEAGIDIPTVSRWLGHVDGGALAMKVYGHLRDSHSVEQAQKVSFTPTLPEHATSFAVKAAPTPPVARKEPKAVASSQKPSKADSWTAWIGGERSKRTAKPSQGGAREP